MVITPATFFKMLIKDQTQTERMLPEWRALAQRVCLSFCPVLLIVSLQSGGMELGTGSTQMTTHTHTRAHITDEADALSPICTKHTAYSKQCQSPLLTAAMTCTVMSSRVYS